MTRKDYRLIAEVIKVTYLDTDYTGRIALEKFTKELSAKLHQDNPRFLYKRFYVACGLEV